MRSSEILLLFRQMQMTILCAAQPTGESVCKGRQRTADEFMQHVL